MKEKQREEAILRLKKLTEKYDLDGSILKMFENGEVVGVNLLNFDLSDEAMDYLAKLITDFEKENNATVYYYIVSRIVAKDASWDTLNLFFVGPYEEEWEEQRETDGDAAFVFAYNLNKLDFSEYGYIGIGTTKDHFLKRTY